MSAPLIVPQARVTIWADVDRPVALADVLRRLAVVAERHGSLLSDFATVRTDLLLVNDDGVTLAQVSVAAL